MTRLLPLLLALCTLFPAPLRARMVEACRERDECCCRRDREAEHAPVPTVRRVDCCEAPCAIEHTSSPVAIPTAREVAGEAAESSLSPPIVGVARVRALSAMPPRGRDPPRRIHALNQRWLV